MSRDREVILEILERWKMDNPNLQPQLVVNALTDEEVRALMFSYVESWNAFASRLEAHVRRLAR